MADPNKELEIKLKATGGAAAAAEIGKVEEAVDDAKKATETLVPAWDTTTKATEEATEATEKLADLQSEMKDRVAAAREKLEELRQTTQKAKESIGGETSGGLSPSVKGLAGNARGLAIAIAQVAGPMEILLNLLDKWAAENAALEGDASRLTSAFRDHATATGEAETKVRDYASELGELSTVQGEANTKFAGAVERVNRLATAQDALKKATIDLRVARGELTKEEGAEMKGEIDADSRRRELESRIELARSAQESAAAEARRAGDAERMATDDLAAAQEQVRQMEERIAKFQSRGSEAAALAGQIDTTLFDMKGSAGEIVTSVGDEKLREMIGLMSGFAGFEAREGLEAGASLENVIGGRAVRVALKKMLLEEARIAEQAVTARKNDLDGLKASAATRAKEVEARQKEREEAERARAAATSGIESAEFDLVLEEQFNEPARQTQVEAGRVAAAAKAQAEADKRAAKAEADAKEAALQAQIKSEAPGFARRADRVEAAGLTEAAAAIDSAATSFANGASSGELESVLFKLSQAALSGSERTKQAIMPVIQATEAIHARQIQIEQELKQRLSNLESLSKANR